jgi:hypothetical protein
MMLMFDLNMVNPNSKPPNSMAKHIQERAMAASILIYMLVEVSLRGGLKTISSDRCCWIHTSYYTGHTVRDRAMAWIFEH